MQNILVASGATTHEIATSNFNSVTLSNLIELLKLPPYKFQPMSSIFQNFDIPNLMIKNIDFTTRTLNVLARNGIVDTLTLWGMSPRDIKDIRNSGFGTLEEVLREIINSMTFAGSGNTFYAEEVKINNATNGTEFKEFDIDFKSYLISLTHILTQQEVELIKSTVAEKLNYPDIFWSQKKKISEGSSDFKFIKSKLSLDGQLSRFVERLNLDVFTFDEFFQSYPGIRFGMQFGYVQISVYELLIFLEYIKAIDGYVLFTNQMSVKQKSILNSKWRESESFSSFKFSCETWGIRLSQKLDEFFVEANVVRVEDDLPSVDPFEMDDLHGEDKWIMKIAELGGSKRFA